MTKSVYLPDIRVEVAFGSGFSTAAASRTWTDVTDYVEFDRSIGIQRGRGDELADIDASSLTVVLNNRDGRFTAGLSSSPYYPNVKLMTPIRVRTAQNYLSANAASMETSVASWSAGGTVPPTLSQSSVRAYDGTKSLLITWGTGGSLPLANTVMSGLTIGNTYTVSAWVWVPTGSPNVSLNAVSGFGAAVAEKDQWALASRTFTATATSHQVQVHPSTSPTAGQQVWVDAVMVSDGSEPTAFTILDSSAATRFVGYVTRWPVEWNGTDADAWATVTATSRTARLGRSNPLDNVLAADILADKPSVYYKLDGLTETLGGDSLVQSGSGAAVTFDGIGPSVDGISAAQFSGGKHLRGPLSVPVNTATSDYWLECTFLTSLAARQDMVNLVDSAGTSVGFIRVEASGTGIGFGVTGTAQASATPPADGLTHHALITISASTKVQLYVDGVLQGTTASAASLNTTATRIAIGDNPELGQPVTGTISNVAYGAGTLTAADIAARAALITGTYDGETAADRVERYAGIAGIPTAEVSADATAVTPMLHVDTTGQSVSDLLKLVATTEGGQVFDARDGTLTYKSRNARYNTTAGLTLNIATGMVEADVQPVYDDQALVNDSTATIMAVGEGEATVAGRTIDQDSVDAYGPYKQDVEVATSDVNDAAGAAGWLVNTHSEPATRIASLTTDVVQLDPATQADALEADIATRVSVTNWPSQVGSTYANGFFVEGYTETISPESWVITFNVSPADHYDVFTLDHADRGDLDSIYPLAW